MSSFLTSFNLFNKDIIYKELCVKDYKVILKCLLNEPVSIHELFLNLNEILIDITNLTKEEILNLNILEYFLLLVKIRMTSIGSSIFASYQQKDSKLNIEISLKNSLDQIQKCLHEAKDLHHKDKNLELIFAIPTIQKLLDSDNDTFLMYIKKAILKDETIDNTTDFINNLPASYISVINKQTSKLKQAVNEFYFYNPSIKKYSINLSIDIFEYIKLIKILYNENLLSVYDNIFYLSKICHLSPEYLESCTYGEFNIFVKKAEEMLQKVTTKNTLSNNLETDETYYEPVDINSLYGNDNIPVQRSEFTP